MPSLPVRVVERVAGRLRFPTLFLITGVLFLADLVVPDAIPLIDELMLGLFTLLLGSWKRRRAPSPDPESVETDAPGE